MAAESAKATRHPTFPGVPPLERALDLLFPPVCVGCRHVGRWICAGCWPKVEWLAGTRCQICGHLSVTPQCAGCTEPGGALRAAIAVAAFGGPAREAVHALKYENRHAIAGLLGRLMADAIRAVEADAVAHVALHSSRRSQRGYDQAAMLARHVASALRLPFDRRALVRTRKTKQQVTLGVAERRANVEGAFLAGHPQTGRRILLVDDVYTTGSTMSSAAQTLRGAGAERVTALVFALAQPGSDRR